MGPGWPHTPFPSGSNQRASFDLKTLSSSNVILRNLAWYEYECTHCFADAFFLRQAGADFHLKEIHFHTKVTESDRYRKPTSFIFCEL